MALHYLATEQEPLGGRTASRLALCPVIRLQHV